MKIFCGLTLFMLMLQSCNNNNQPTSETNTDTVIKNSRNTNNDTIAAVERDNDPLNSGNKSEFEKLIIPGERIGKTELNTDADKLEALLGMPDVSDAGMGKAWLTWNGRNPDEHNNKTELNIYTAYKDTGMRERTLQQVRVTSSYFVTGNNIHVYSTLNEIKNAFPQILKVGQYKDEERNIVVFDDVKQGIAFEIADANNQHICTGIIIHAKGKKLTDIYIMLHPDMQKI